MKYFDLNLLKEKKVFISGIEERGKIHRFSVVAKLINTGDCVEVDNLAYPYRIYISDFDYCWVDKTLDTIAARDDCLIIYLKNDRSVRLFYSDYSYS